MRFQQAWRGEVSGGQGKLGCRVPVGSSCIPAILGDPARELELGCGSTSQTGCLSSPGLEALG